MSFLITRNVVGTITQLILRGLIPGSISPGDIPNIGLVGLGSSFYFFNEYVSEGGVVSEYGVMPADAYKLTWQVVYGSEPSSAQIILQGSNNGINWSTLDTSEEVSGEVRSINSAAKFVRARFGTMEDGIPTSVIGVVEPISIDL